MQHAVYQGQVFHARFHPRRHSFTYQHYMLWLDLTALAGTDKQRWLSGAIQFRRSDYLGDPNKPLHQEVLSQMSALAGKTMDGKVFMLGQVRTLGLYFSPVNFYFLQQENGQFSHMLAEVSNTPWDQCHCYLLDLNNQQPHEKAFHVSPFNPIDMTYHWQVLLEQNRASITIDAAKEVRHFTAQMNLKRMPLNQNSLWHVVKCNPWITLLSLLRIYWQAMKLFLKRTPVYSHPGNK